MAGSMSGFKIKSAVENVLNIFDTHIYGNDYIMVITFNGDVAVNIPLGRKEGQENAIRESIKKLSLPSGSTGMSLLATITTISTTTILPSILYDCYY